jgi:predicted nucleotidyltransferase component of viral defense system
MLGYLDRFSIDLDFDVLVKGKKRILRNEFHKVFENQTLKIVKEYDKVLFFQVRYQSMPGERNLMKVSVSDVSVKANEYEIKYLTEIDRMMKCQTIETMFANKLVAVIDRYNLHETIAGRDIYDIHYFFTRGYSYNISVISERTGMGEGEYLKKLAGFINKYVTQRLIDEDLNTLLPEKQFYMVRKVIIPETLSLLKKVSH